MPNGVVAVAVEPSMSGDLLGHAVTPSCHSCLMVTRIGKMAKMGRTEVIGAGRARQGTDGRVVFFAFFLPFGVQ